MLDNFIEEYHPFHNVYHHDSASHDIYIGDISAALDLQFISTHHIRTVVTAAIGMDQVQYSNSQIKHIVYPLLDAKHENISKLFAQFYDLVEKEIQKGNILVHCAAGISRSSTLVISYLMKKQLWTFKDAIQHIRKTRKNVCPNLGFERQLKAYEQVIKNASPHYKDEQLRIISKTSEARKNMEERRRASKLPQIGFPRKQLSSRDQHPKANYNNLFDQGHGFVNISFYGQSKNNKFAIRDIREDLNPKSQKFNIRNIKQSSSEIKRKQGASLSQRNSRPIQNRHFTQGGVKFNNKLTLSEMNNFHVIKLNINERKIRTEKYISRQSVKDQQ